MSDSKTIHLKALTVFCLFLAWFHFQYPHYEPLTLTMVKSESIQNGKLILSWDSGYGYTGYERKELDLSKPSVEFKLPPNRIERLKIQGGNGEPLGSLIEKFEVIGAAERITHPKSEFRNEVEITSLPGTKKFNAFLFVFQLFLSLLVTGSLLLLSSFFGSKGGIVKFFSDVDERCFLLTFLFLFTAYLLWVAAYWPVAMTNDSWSTLGDVKALRFTDWHPYFYGFFILGLLNFFDCLGIVALAQAFATALILSYGFYYCAKQGVRWLYLTPLIVFLGLSIPIGAYNTIMWKDVPYSLSILLLSIFAFKFGHLRQTTNRKATLETGEQFLLLLTMLGVVFFRHNGIIYVPFLPLLFYLLLEKKSFRRVILSFAVCFVLFKIVIPKALDIKKPPGAPYQQMKLTLAIMMHPAFYSPTRDEDVKTIEDATKHSWKTLKENYPQKWFWLWDNSEVGKNQWNPRGGQTEKYNTAFLLKLIYYNLSIFIAEQTFGFFHSIGLDSDNCDRFNGFYEDPMQTFGSNLAPPGIEMWGLVVHRNPPAPGLSSAAESLINWSTDFKGIFSIGFLVWGLHIVFLLMLLILVCELPGSAVSLYVLSHLLSAAFVFLIGAGESWRYFYNIYLSLFLLIPFWYLSRKQRMSLHHR